MPNTLLHLTSYNILGQSHTHYLKTADPEFLLSNSRFPLLVEQLKSWQHQIYALQEAELPFLAALTQALPSYSCFFAQRPQGKQDGLAFLVHTDLHVYSVQSRFFLSLDGQASSRLCQQLIIDWQGRQLAIVQAHISYDQNLSQQHEGLYQMKQFLAGLPHQSCDGIILCGDWNAPVEHPVFQETQKYGFVDALASHRYPTCLAGKQPLSIDHIVHSETVQSQVLPLAPSQPISIMPNHEQGSDHLAVGVALQWK